MSQMRIVQRYKTRGCLLSGNGILIAWIVISWIASFSHYGITIMGHCFGTLFCALIVIPLIFAFKKLAKPTLVEEIEYHDDPPIQIIDSKYIPVDIRRVVARPLYKCSNSWVSLSVFRTYFPDLAVWWRIPDRAVFSL